MSFPLTPALAFTASVSTIPSAVLNEWRTYIARSLDTLNGGVYSNTTLIRFGAGSAGWRFDGLVRVGGTGTLQLDAGATVTVNANVDVNGELRCKSGSTLRLYGGAGGQFDASSNVTCNGNWTFGQDSITIVNGSSGHLAAWAWGQYSSVTHGSGSTDEYAAGSVLAIKTALATLGQDAILTVNGASGHVAQVVRGQYSTDTYQSGAGFTGNAGSIFVMGGGYTWAGTSTETHASGSAETYASGSTATHASGSTDTYASGSTLALNGTVTGAATRTGSVTLSGTGAWTALRVAVAADPPTNTDAREYDLLLVKLLTADSVLSLDTLGADVTHLIRIRYSAITHTLSMREAGLVHDLFVFSPIPGSQQTIEMFWDGSAWNVGLVGAVTAV